MSLKSESAVYNGDVPECCASRDGVIAREGVDAGEGVEPQNKEDGEDGKVKSLWVVSEGAGRDT